LSVEREPGASVFPAAVTRQIGTSVPASVLPSGSSALSALAVTALVASLLVALPATALEPTEAEEPSAAALETGTALFKRRD
jgi:hypothetical protein